MNLRYLTLFAGLLFFVGCDGESGTDGPAPVPTETTEPSENPAKTDGSGATESKGTIGVSVLTLENPFFKVIADELTAEAKKLGYDTIVVSGDKDVAKQSNQLKDFIVKGVVAIVLCPCDSRSIGPAIKEANEAGIPVFTTDIACLAPGVEVVTHIATDNLGGGREAGTAMIEVLGETGGEIAILDFPQAESCLLRVQGFMEVLNKHNEGREKGKIEVVSKLDGGGATDQGYKGMQDIIQAHPNIVGVFAINDPSALGAYAALKEANKVEQVKIIGFDGQPDGKQAIKEGKIYADPIQFPDKMGIESARAIVKHFKGEELPKETLIPTKLYRKADADADPDLK